MIAFWTLFYKELLRFWKVAFQTVAAPVLTALLYLVIFGHVLEDHVRIHDVPYTSFLIPGLVYGKITGTIKNDKDAARLMGDSMRDMGPYIILAFFAAQFLAYFTWSNLGIVLSVKGAEALQSAGLTGVGLIIGFIFISSLINIFVGSASAKWAIMAPIFVPMFLLIGFDPALTQMAYRIGDSLTNPLTPLLPYFPIILSFARKYDKNIGMGTLISNMLPYSIAFAIFWVVLLIIFIVFQIPLGPGAGIYYQLH